MTLLQRLRRWHAAGTITPEQFHVLTSLESRQRMSVYFELHALLYLGVLSFIGGLGWTIKAHFGQWGDAAVIGGLATLFVGCLGYCLYKAHPFTRLEVDSPNFVFDYVLYLGCLSFSTLLAYLEYRFSILAAQWDIYLLIAACTFFILAYRFDNRFVLSIGLSTLATWFGVKLTGQSVFHFRVLRVFALEYALCIAGLGALFAWQNIKAHFRETYYQLAANILLLAAVNGVFDKENMWLWLGVLLVASAVVLVYGLRTQQFSFVAIAVVYSYIGVSCIVSRDILGDMHLWGWIYFYFLISGILVVAGLVRMARRFGTS